MLVSRTSSTAGAVLYLHRPDTAFVTHLLATAQHAPQTRTIRRADPDQAIAGYTRTESARTGAIVNAAA